MSRIAITEIQDVKSLEKATEANKLAPLNQLETKVDAFAVQTLSNSENLSPANAANFKPLTAEQIEKMDIKQLLDVIMQCTFLIQHDARRTNTAFLQTIQITLDSVVKKLSSIQASTMWAIPAFAAAALGAASGLTGDYRPVLEGFSGCFNTIKEMVKVTNDAEATPVSAEQAQLHATLSTTRERETANHQDIEKVLNQIEGSLRSLHDLIINMAR